MTDAGGARPAAQREGAHGRARSARTLGFDLALFALVVVAALSLRLAYVEQLRASPFFERHVMDPLYHHQWAQAFAAGREAEFIGGAYFRAPLYPWLLGSVYWLTGESPGTPRRLQAVIGSLSCGLLFLIGRRAFGRAVGGIAGLAAATYPMLMYFDSELKTEGLSIFLNLLLMLLLMRTQERRGVWRWGIAGILLGLSAITRPTILLFAPALVMWVFWLHGRAWRRSLGYSAALFLGTVATIVPITVRNAVVGGDAALIATSGGVNFYIGNNPGSDGMSAVIPGDPPSWWPCYHAQIERAERAMGRELTGSEVSQWYARQAWAWIVGHPLDALRHTLRKLAYFWSYWEVSNNQDIRFVFSHYTTLTSYLPLRFGVIAPLALVGLLASLLGLKDAAPPEQRDRPSSERVRAWFPLWAFALVYSGAIVAFFVSARYRIPVVIVLILLASLGVVWLVRQIRARRWAPLAAAGVVLACGGWAASRTPPGVDLEMIQGHVAAGMFLAADERYADAEPVLSEAVARARRTGWRLQPEVPAMLGRIRLQRGAAAEAIEPLEYAVELNPADAVTRQILAAALAMQDRGSDAIAQSREALRLEPQSAEIRAQLGALEAQHGNASEGVALLEAAVRADASLAARVTPAAQALVRRGQNAAALRALEAAAIAAPDDLAILTPLIQLRVSERAGEPAETVALAERALKLSGRRDPLVLLACGLAYDAAGDRPTARELFESALPMARQANQAALVAQIEQAIRRQDRRRP